MERDYFSENVETDFLDREVVRRMRQYVVPKVVEILPVVYEGEVIRFPVERTRPPEEPDPNQLAA